MTKRYEIYVREDDGSQTIVGLALTPDQIGPSIARCIAERSQKIFDVNFGDSITKVMDEEYWKEYNVYSDGWVPEFVVREEAS